MSRIQILALIIFAELVSFGIFAPQMGFYHDDWSILELAQGGESFWTAVKAYASSEHFFNRPLEILHFPIIITLGGLHPIRYQIMLLGLEILEAWLLFVLFKRLTNSQSLALSASLLALMCPNRAITHVWMVNSPQTVSLILVELSLLAHMDWLDSGRNWRLAASQLLYLASILNYEATAFLPLMLAGALAVDGRQRQKLPLLWPYALSLALDAWWQWPQLRALGVANPKTLDWPGYHMLKALGAGFECVTNRIIHICASSFWPAFQELGVGLIIGCAAFSTAVITWGRWDEKPKKESLKPALGAILGGLFGAYMPYAVSSSYMPQIYGIMSRTNGSGAWVAGLAWACGLLLCRSNFLRRFLVALVISAFTWTNWHSSVEYAGAWRLEQDILGKLSPQAKELPPDAMVLMAGAPRFVGHAVAFDASWDFPAALRLAARRKDINADLIDAGTRFEKKGVALTGRNELMPYGNLFLYDYPQNALHKLQTP